jgi:Myotubularin-like phosphatase domain
MSLPLSAVYVDPLTAAALLRKSSRASSIGTPAESSVNISGESVSQSFSSLQSDDDFSGVELLVSEKIIAFTSTGTFLTNLRFFVSKDDSIFLWKILKVSFSQPNYMIIETITFKQIRFQFDANDLDFYQSLQTLTRGETICKSFYPSLSHTRFSALESDFDRLHMKQSLNLRLYNNEISWVCDSYPLRFPVPQSFTDSDVETASKFRSKGRMPICTYPNIWRSGQPKTSLGYRNEMDEKLLEFASNKGKLCIFDLRAALSAYANQLAGQGTETLTNYPFATLKFCDIPNIHALHKIYKQTWENIYSRDEQELRGLWVIFEEWYVLIQLILRTAVEISNTLLEKSAVLIHCSDGWDRTAQMTCLIQIILDPFYRSKRGFLQLIHKEFIECGFRFRSRTKDESEFSPIFVQFLDCVFQILFQNKEDFEFDENFLLALLEMSISGRYPDFCFDNAKERSGINLCCYWDSLLKMSKTDWMVSNDSKNLKVDFRPFKIEIWKKYWFE